MTSAPNPCPIIPLAQAPASARNAGSTTLPAHLIITAVSGSGIAR